MKKTIWVVLALLLFLCAIGAVSGDENAALSGKYYLSSMELEGELFDEELLELLNFDLNDCYIEFLDGGKCIMHLDGKAIAGTYKADGETFTIIDDDGSVDDGVIEGNKVSLVGDDAKMTFTKK